MKRRWALILIAVVTSAAVAAVFWATAEPRYSATASVQIVTETNEALNFSTTAEPAPPDSLAVDTEVEILRSTELLRRVATELELAEDPEFNSALRPPTRGEQIMNAIAGILGGDRANAAEAVAQVPDTSALSRAVDALKGRLDIARLENSFVIAVTVESESAVKAATIANHLADVYITRQLERKFDATQRANTWLSERLSLLRSEVEDAEQDVERYRAESGLLAADGSPLVERRIADISEQLSRARADLAESEARLTAVQSRLNRGESADAILEVLTSEVIRELRRQQAEVSRRKADFESEYGPRHPDMMSINRELADLERQIDQEVRRTVEGLANEVSVRSGRVASLEESRREVEAELVDSNQSLVRLRELERNADASRAVYEAFLNRFRMTTEQQDVEDADAQIISAATASLEPSWPRPNMVFAFALVGAFGLSAAFVGGAEFLDRGIRTQEDLERILKRPVVGSVPRLTAKDLSFDGEKFGPASMVKKRPFTSFSESFRGIKAALQLADPDEGCRIILVTSALPREGKTLTTLSFARSLAISGMRVIAIDGDLRVRGLTNSVEREFGQIGQGLVELLGGKATLQDVLLHDDAGLDIIPVSSTGLTAQDVFSSEEFRRLLERLKGEYDAVLIDSPPALAVADAVSLAAASDIVIQVVKWAQTPRSAAKKALEEIEHVKTDEIYALLSCVDRATMQGYGKYSAEKYRDYFQTR